VSLAILAYDWSTDSWSLSDASRMTHDCQFHTSTLPNGRILRGNEDEPLAAFRQVRHQLHHYLRLFPPDRSY
jgi:hypothetical protein